MTKRRKKQEPIAHQVIKLLTEKGPLRATDMVETIGHARKVIYQNCLNMMHLGFLEQGEGENCEWSLVPGVSLDTYLRAKGQPEQKTTAFSASGSGQHFEPQDDEEDEPEKGRPLTQRDLFCEHLMRVGVSPKDAIPTIADIFFAGDTEDLRWLKQVLERSAAGFVTAKQVRLIMDWWRKTQMPVGSDDLPDLAIAETGKGKGNVMDPGMGWKVTKDDSGDFVVVPGGPIQDYERALEHAERMMVAKTYSRGFQGDGDEGGSPQANGSPDQEGQPVRRGKRGGGENMQDYMTRRAIDFLIEGGNRGDSTEVKEMRAEIARMREDQNQERFERLEAMVSQALTRDPLADWDMIQERRRKLGITDGPVVTDQSPAVQLIKDTGDKFDRNVSRLTGLVERVMLRSGEFTPEETRSPEDREQKAENLLGEAQRKKRQRDQRRETFGV